MMSCMPPDSSKKRSNTTVSSVGKVPSAALPALKYCTIWNAAASSRPTVS